MSGGGPQETTSVQKTEIADEAKPFLTPALQDAYNLYKSPGPADYPSQYGQGSTIAGFSPEQLQAQAGTVARATNGSPLNMASGQYVQDVLGGNYLNQGNPYQSQIDDQISARVASDASLHGRMGSNYQARALTEGLAAPRYQNYQNERGLQQTMAQFAPQLAGQDYLDLGQLNQVGLDRQGMAQGLINENVGSFNYNQNLAQNKNNVFLSQLYGYPGRTQTTTQPYQGPSTGQQVLGGLLGIGGLGLGFL